MTRIWFFYEYLTGKQLPVKNLTTGNYVDALEAKDYYTVQDGKKSSRHRVVNNLLGSKAFCPVVRRTEKLSNLDSSGLMFPVSAVMLKNSADYDTSLESFSKPLLQLIDYRLDKMGQMTVDNDTASWYQYMDMTPQSEALYEFIKKNLVSCPRRPCVHVLRPRKAMIGPIAASADEETVDTKHKKKTSSYQRTKFQGDKSTLRSTFQSRIYRGSQRRK